MWTTLVLSSLRLHLQLDSYLHSSHQQCLEPHPVHFDHQLFQRAGGSLTLSLAEKTHLEKRPQKPHFFHNLHGDPTGSLLPATSLLPACITEWRRSPLCLRGAGTFLALLLSGKCVGSYMTVVPASFKKNDPLLVEKD